LLSREFLSGQLGLDQRAKILDLRDKGPVPRVRSARPCSRLD
jgi:hypothetical protein